MSTRPPTRYTDATTHQAARVDAAREAAGHIVVIATGDRNARLEEWGLIVWWALHETVAGYRTWTLCHGDGRGIDQLSEAVAAEIDPRPSNVRRYPADWRAGRGAGPRRAPRMLREAHTASLEHDFPVVVLAFRDGLEPGSGTADCVAQARSLGLSVAHYTSLGEITLWHPNAPTEALSPSQGITPRGRRQAALL